MIRVAVAGCAGKMGREVVRAVSGASDMALVGAASPRHAGEDAGTLAGVSPVGVPIHASVSELLAGTVLDVLVDMTTPAVVHGHLQAAIVAGVHAVVGTTGLGPQQLADLDARARDRGVGVLVAPNFAIGAILMMRFAEQAAAHFEAAEIVELHHDRKQDAPSATALRTAEAMAKARDRFQEGISTETLPGVRGGATHGIHVHSVRLPGVVASQEVIFGGLGQLLTIRHDTFSRESFMPGVLLAIRKVGGLRGLVHGLDRLI